MVNVGAMAAGGLGVNIVISAVDNFSKNFAKAGIAAKGLGGVAKGLAIGLGAVAVAAGVVATIVGVKSVNAFKKAEVGYAKVNTLLDVGQDAQGLYGDQVKKLNVLLADQGDQVDVLNGLYQTISAGISDTADATLFMEQATRAAVAGSAELPTVIEAGTKAIAAFGLEVEDSERVFDVFSATVKAGQTTMGQLANAFPSVAGVAAEMGATLEETAATFAGLTKVMKNPEEVATSLRAVFTGLLKPSDDLKNGLKELGFESGKAAIDQLGLMKTLNLLKDSVDGDSEAMGKMFQNVRAIKAIFPALGTASGEIAASFDIISDAAGMTSKQLADMQNTAANAIGTFKSEIENTSVEVGANISTSISPALVTLRDELLPAIKLAMENMGNGFATTMDEINDTTAVSDWAYILEKLGGIGQWLGKVMADLIKWLFMLPTMFKNAFQLITGFIDLLSKDMYLWLTKVNQWIGDNLTDPFIQGIENIANAAIKAKNKLTPGTMFDIDEVDFSSMLYEGSAKQLEHIEDISTVEKERERIAADLLDLTKEQDKFQKMFNPDYQENVGTMEMRQDDFRTLEGGLDDPNLSFDDFVTRLQNMAGTGALTANSADSLGMMELNSQGGVSTGTIVNVTFEGDVVSPDASSFLNESFSNNMTDLINASSI